MTEDEWAATPPADAVATFVIFIMKVFKLTVGGILISAATRGFNATMTEKLNPLAEAQLAEKPELAAHVAKVRGLFDSRHDDSLRNGLIIIALVSAFEACFEDFCKGVMQMDPSVLDDKDLPKPKYTMTQFLSTSEENKRDVIYESIENAVGKSNGIDRYENILKFLNLSEHVPDPIKDTFYKAQVIRHVWAHRAGIADKKFVTKAPHLGFNEGDLVAVTIEDLSQYLVTILSYALILTNRHRALFGFDPIPLSATQFPIHRSRTRSAPSTPRQAIRDLLTVENPTLAVHRVPPTSRQKAGVDNTKPRLDPPLESNGEPGLCGVTTPQRRVR